MTAGLEEARPDDEMKAVALANIVIPETTMAEISRDGPGSIVFYPIRGLFIPIAGSPSPLVSRPFMD